MRKIIKTDFLILSLCLLTGLAFTSELPVEKLGRPLRIHVARGLWWQMLRLEEAFGIIGGADISSSVDVYGSPNGYHGCARAMATFPHDIARLNDRDIIVLAGSRIAALPSETQSALVSWVRAGGGLLVTGGPLSLDCDDYGPLADILPVVLTREKDLAQTGSTNIIVPVGDSPLTEIDWSASPRVYWYNSGTVPREGTTTLLTALEKPLLTTHKVGLGRVTVFTGTVCGKPAKDEISFWNWTGWPEVIAQVVLDLTPPKDRILLPLSRIDPSKIKDAKARLSEISDNVLEGFLEEFEAVDAPVAGSSFANDSGKELTSLAMLTRDTAFAQSLINAIIDSNARLTIEQSESIFNAVTPYLDPVLCGTMSEKLIQSSSPGTVALGLRIAGWGKNRSAGNMMVKVLDQGIQAMKVNDERSPLVSSRISVPDGKDEDLRLAVAQALVDLGDPSLAVSTRKALDTWVHKRSRISTLADKQKDVDEMVAGALAAMGDGLAAVQIVELYIENNLAKELAVDISERRTRSPSKSMIREQEKALVMIGVLSGRIKRLHKVLSCLPTDTWPELADNVKNWDGEFAAEALLLALSVKDEATLSQNAMQALTSIAKETPIPAVSALCRTSLKSSKK